MKELYGDILLVASESANFGHDTFLCHQVSTVRRLGPVLGQRIALAYPVLVDEYNSFNFKLGDVLMFSVRPHLCIVFLVAQETIRPDTNIEALLKCLNSLSQYMAFFPRASILFPKGMGCVRGAAEWDSIEHLIDISFKEHLHVYKVGWSKSLR